jgi:uncharacterized membrane protein YfcA
MATPLLLYVVGLQPHVAIGTGALAVSVNAFANFGGHARSGNARWRCAVIFAVIGLGGAAFGSMLGKQVVRLLCDRRRFLIVPGLLFSTGMPMIFAISSSLLAVGTFGLTTAISYGIPGLINWPVAFRAPLRRSAGRQNSLQLGLRLLNLASTVENPSDCRQTPCPSRV